MLNHQNPDRVGDSFVGGDWKLLGYLNLNSMFPSDERVFAMDLKTRQVRNKQVTRQEMGSNDRPKTDFVCVYSSKPISDSRKTMFLVMYLLILCDHTTQIYTSRQVPRTT